MCMSENGKAMSRLSCRIERACLENGITKHERRRGRRKNEMRNRK